MRTTTKRVLFCAALALVAGLAFVLWRSRNRHMVRAPAPPATPVVSATPPGTLRDPLAPERLVQRDDSRKLPPDWVSARPAFQTSRSAAERNGVEPCATQPFDRSGFEAWNALSRGHFTLPKGLELDGEGGFDLVMHLNGDEPVLRELVESGQRFVLYTFTLPPTESYAAVFADPRVFPGLLDEVEQQLSKRAGKPAHHRHVALSAWSAGFAGVRSILPQPAAENIDAVVLVDGLHAPRGDARTFEAQLEPFASYAARAAAGERLFLVSHSSIDPPDFASTTECAHYLIHRLGAEPQPVEREDPLGLELVEYFTRGDFHVRGYSGNAKADHCAQLGVLRGAFVALGKRWAKATAAR